jgi:protein phosphatase
VFWRLRNDDGASAWRDAVWSAVVNCRSPATARILANGALTQLTTDDTWEATLLAGGNRSLPSTSRSMAHVLTNVLGAQETAIIHLREHDLHGGETILLCSDGLHNAVDDRELARLLALDDPLADIGARLIDAALAAGAATT